MRASTGGSNPQKPVRGVEEIGPIVARWLKGMQVPQRLAEDGIFGQWKEIVGEEIAAVTRVARCSGGVLTVEVASAPLLLELQSYYREGILESIRARPDLRSIHQIRFRAGAGGR